MVPVQAAADFAITNTPSLTLVFYGLEAFFPHRHTLRSLTLLLFAY